VLNGLFVSLLALDARLIRFMDVPVGTSVLIVARKDKPGIDG
jgi:hypothetical protein